MRSLERKRCVLFSKWNLPNLSTVLLPNWNGSATVIVGKMGKISQQLIELANQVSWEINVSEHVENMVPEMLKSDIAIVSGGSTMWELLYMKVPFLAISLNKVQQSYLEFLELEELCVNLGWYEQLSLERINNTLCDFVQDETYRSKILDHADLLLERENNGKEILMSLNAQV